ncbi:MAG: hypothetical protein KGY81_09120, partial [Phycisphaerae bacterium]|nr:hypothetical protein [Phycisphaerae bacterium]
QSRLTELLASSGRSGSIVVIDVESGEVLAMVSWPVFDLNTYRRDRLELETDQVNLPMLHRAVAAAYAPGSTVKPLTALAGLGAGKITPATTFNCPGYLYVAASGQKRHRCWLRSGHGPVDLQRGIRESCNVYFNKIGSLLKAPLLTYWMGLFGFGEQPGTGLPGETSGVLATEAWLQANRMRGFLPSDKWFISIGQGVFAATPLQVANAHAAIARDGVFVAPRVIKDIEDGDGRSADVRPPEQVRRELPIATEHARAVREGMHEVIHDSRGTAYTYWRSGLPLGVEACGKTGTAQVPPMRIDSNGDGELTVDDQVVRQGDHAWFAGFAPYRQPNIAFAVLIEYAGSGGRNAAPVAKEVIRACIAAGYLGQGESESGRFEGRRSQGMLAQSYPFGGRSLRPTAVPVALQRGEDGNGQSRETPTDELPDDGRGDGGLAPTAVPVAPLRGEEGNGQSREAPTDALPGDGEGAHG